MTMLDASMKKRVLGVATYSATRFKEGGLVTLTAVGVLPCINYEAQLEQRPERILPPNWDMAFYIEDVCLKALKPFELSVIVSGSNEAESITVVDSIGRHEVPVITVSSINVSEQPFAAACDLDEFCVYARVPAPFTGQQHQGCIVLPADVIVAAIYYRAFGPASKADCDAFVEENCIKFAGDYPLPWLENEAEE